MKQIKNIFALAMVVMFLPVVALAVPGAPGGNRSSSNISYKGSFTISSDTSIDNQNYSSVTSGENAVLVNGGSSTISGSNVSKSGDESNEDSDFYGTNAAVLVYNSAVLSIDKSTITTSGSHANGLFAYGTGILNVSDSTINTTGNNSGGIMVTGGGTLNASNLTVKTTGNSSAAIRSDRGGGNLSVENGTYETNGVGSPAIYSTADITVKKATLNSTSSEGAIVEGANSITLEEVTLTDTNNTLNGNSETYKNIFLYQSMSGDAESGTASFTSKKSKITTNKGDTIFVTNTTAIINLEDNEIINNDGDFLRIQKGKWGNSGSNGGNVTLNMANQNLQGNIIIDDISTLEISLKEKSVLISTLNASNEAKKLSLNISKDSILSLDGDSYISSLNNELEDNSNIYSNGYKLYVDNKEVNINSDYYLEEETEEIKLDSANTSVKNNNNKLFYLIAISTSAIILIVLIILIFKRKNKTK